MPPLHWPTFAPPLTHMDRRMKAEAGKHLTLVSDSEDA
jgi:hypothetical protein